MFEIAPTATRVCSNTAPLINGRIHQRTIDNVAFFVMRPAEIPHRLLTLDHEWDVERVIGTSSAVLTVAGLALAFASDPRWFAPVLLVQFFYLQHALQGWCPALPLLRRFGFRTEQEIQFERNQLEMTMRQYAASPLIPNPTFDWN